MSRAARWPIDPYIEEFLAQMDAAGMPARIVSKIRTQEEQDRLYAQGRTTAGPVVTWTTRSKHIGGRAFDFNFQDPGWEDSDEAWNIAASIGDGLGLKWGGDWNTPDKYHFELQPGEG